MSDKRVGGGAFALLEGCMLGLVTDLRFCAVGLFGFSSVWPNISKTERRLSLATDVLPCDATDGLLVTDGRLGIVGLLAAELS